MAKKKKREREVELLVSAAVDRIEQLTWTIIAMNIDGELMKGNRY